MRARLTTMCAGRYFAIGSAGVLAILLGTTDLAFAAGSYTVDFGFEQYVEHDDNVNFTVDNETDATGFILTPHVGLKGQTPRWTFGANLDTPFERYSESLLDSDNQDLSLTAERTLERGSVGFDGLVRRDSTHSIDEAGTVERIADRRVLDSLSAHWVRKVGQRHEIRLTGTGQKALYDSSLRCEDDFECRGTSRLNDYEYTAIQVDWTRLMSERLSTQVGVYGTRYEAEQAPELKFQFQGLAPPFDVPLDVPDVKTDTVALQGGLIRVFNEQLRGTFLVGVRRVETTRAFWNQDCVYLGTFCFIPLTNPFLSEAQNDSSGSVAIAGIDYTGERLEVSAALTRRLEPSGLALLLETNELAIDLSYQLRERLFLRLRAQGRDSEGEETTLYTDATTPPLFQITKFDRQFYSLRPHVRWEFRHRWWLDAGVEMRNQERLIFNGIVALPVTFVDPGQATSNIVFVSVGYRTDPIPVFR